MVSIRDSVNALYKENKSISVDDLRREFPDANSKTLSNALSYARKLFPVVDGDSWKLTKITEEQLEQAILDRVNHVSSKISREDINLAINFLKIKRADAGLEDDLDIEKYLKKLVVKE